MRGSGKCPCTFADVKFPCIKKECEIFDEYAMDCGVNVIVRELRDIKRLLEQVLNTQSD